MSRNCPWRTSNVDRSEGSADRGDKFLTITRKTFDKFGQPTTTYERVTNPRVIALYRKRRMEKALNDMKSVIPLYISSFSNKSAY